MINEEPVKDEEIVEDTEEVVQNTEEEVREEEIEEEVREERYKKNVIDELLELKEKLTKDKYVQTLLILNRVEGANLTRLSKEIHASHKRMREILRDLVGMGYVVQYRRYPDTNIYYKLSERGKKIIELIYQIILFKW